LSGQQVAAGSSPGLLQLLLQQQQHLFTAAAAGLGHQLPCSYQQRVMAALPVPGPTFVQLPSPVMGPASGAVAEDVLLQSVSSTGAAGSQADTNRLGQQQQQQQQQGQSQQAASQRLHVWVPICPPGVADTSRRAAAAAAAAADLEAAGAGQQVGGGDAAAAAQLLRGCVRQPKQKLLYLASGYDSD
jgi:hypothetical protein